MVSQSQPSGDGERAAPTTSEPAAARVSDDQFWALERWIILLSTAAAMPPGFHDPAHLQSVRDTAYVALTGKTPTP